MGEKRCATCVMVPVYVMDIEVAESKIRPRGVCQTWKTRTPSLGSPKVQCKKSLIFLLLLRNESLAGAGLKNRIYKNE